jgi:hypothetical protein
MSYDAPLATLADPVLTGSIYARGRLDEVVGRVLAPLRRELERDASASSCYLWLVRYPRCGEHLKVRLHGPAALRGVLQERLEAAVAEYFAALGPAVPRGEAAGLSAATLPPLDIEDEAPSDYPDRTLLWTHYRRSHLSLGGEPLLGDDRYAMLMTRSLAMGCDEILDTLAAGKDKPLPPGQRQTVLLRLLIDGLCCHSGSGRAGQGNQWAAAYLTYHRDWLLRFATAHSSGPTEKSRALLQLCEAHATRAERWLAPLGLAARAQWRLAQADGDNAPAAPSRQPDGGRDTSAWRRALCELIRYIAPLCSDSRCPLDPYATDPVFPALFKVFHGSANQLGLNMLDEALAHHLLLRATAPPGARRATANSLPMD